MCGPHGSDGASSSSRSARLVRIWYWCQFACVMVSKTRRMNSSGTSLWYRSDMLLTKIFRGFFQRSGTSSMCSCRVSSKPLR